MDQGTIDANRAQQAALYGRPLGEVVRDLIGSLHLSQGRIAEVLGMSAPMLSQLSSGQRVKIGNPQAVSRLQALVELSGVAAGLTAEQVEARLAEVSESAATIATATSLPPQDVVARLAALSGPAGLLAAARAAAPHSKALAEVLQSAAGHHG